MASSYTDQQLLQILRDLAAELGRAPTIREMQAGTGLSPRTYYNHFGSWNAALKTTGLEIRRHHTPTYTGERLIDILRDLARELGRTPTKREMLARPGLPSPRTYHRHFGSWNAALETAGLKPNRRIRKTRITG